MPGFKILFIGGSGLELNVNVFKLPEAGASVTDDGGVAYIPSGRGALAAAAAAKMGAESILCTKLGADSHGRQLYSYYKEAGIDSTFVKADRDRPSGFSVVIKEADGVKRRISYPGANLALTQENVIEALESSPDAVYISLEVPFAVATVAAKAAAAQGIPVFIDGCNASKDYPLEDLPPVEVFCANVEEMQEYTGETPAGATASLRAALAINKRVECRYLVIKQGSRGSFLYDGKHYQMEAALRIDKPLDTSGAGDVFTAALALEYVRSKGDIYTAIRYATAASAISVTRIGSASSAPTDAEVMAVYNESYT